MAAVPLSSTVPAPALVKLPDPVISPLIPSVVAAAGANPPEVLDRVTPRVAAKSKVAEVASVPPFIVSWFATRLTGAVPKSASAPIERVPPVRVVMPV